MYEIENREHKPKNFFAGDFPILPESGVAGEALGEYTLVAKNDDGNIISVTAETIGNVIGITAAASEVNTPVVYYMTGEFFSDVLNMPTGVTADEAKEALRKISVFLR